MEKQLYSSLEKNKQEFESYFGNSADYFFKYVKIFNVKAAVVMCEDLTDAQRLWEVMLHPLNDLKGTPTGIEVFDYILHDTTIPLNSGFISDFEKAMFHLTSGFVLLLIDGVDKALVLPAQGYPARGVDQPSSEGNLRGSKESFTDAGRKNMALIRRRIRSKHLMIETMQVGEKTKTELSIYYHKDYCPPELVQQVKDRLHEIKLPMVFEAGYISPFVDSTKYSLFQAVGYTERPDTFCAKLCEGKVGVLVDGTPYAMVYPHFFHENFITNDDYTQRPYFASFIRLLRYIAFIIAIALPGLYVAFTAFAPEALPQKLLFFIYSSKDATPLPLFLEAVLITVLLEIVKEAGLRLPQPIGNTVSLVAALIIGDAAISAGLIGSAILIVCATSIISSFVIPAFYEPIIVLRLLFIIFAGIFGIGGVAFSFMFLIVNIINVNACGFDYTYMLDMSRINPFRDGITKTSWRKMKNDNFDLRGQTNEK